MNNKKKIMFISIVVILLIILAIVVFYHIKEAEQIKNKVETGKVDNSSVDNNQIKEDNESDNHYYEDVIDTIDNVTIMRTFINENGENYLTYTKRNENNEVIWNYKTKSEKMAGQCYTVEHIDITEDRIYINELGTIIVLNKEDGKIIWSQDDYNGNRFSSSYLDDEYNLYLIGTEPGMLYIIDKEGKIKVKIENELLSEAMVGDGFRIDLENEKYLLFEGMWRSIFINLKDYSVIIKDESIENKFVLKKVNKESNTIWKYEKNNKVENVETEIRGNKIYINMNGTIIVLNIENGKAIFEKEVCDGGDYESVVMHFDESENLYLIDHNTNTLYIIDKDGNEKSKIKHKVISGYYMEGYLDLHFIDNNRLLISSDTGILHINLKNYSIKYSIVYSLDSKEDALVIKDNKNNVINEYKIEKSSSNIGCSEFIDCVKNRMYINISGTIVAIDVENGKVIWQNSDYAGGGYSYSCFDSDSNLYISSKYDVSGVKSGPDLHIIDKHGKTLKRIERFDNSEGYPTEEIELRNNESELVIDSYGTKAYIIDLKDYSIKLEDI